jgi:NAD-dependent deacetylase
VSDVTTIAGLLRDAQRIVVLTGAGISTGSGIPDFRGPDGVWTKDPAAEKRATIQHYVSDPEHRKRAWRGRLEGDIWQGEPNAGHYALAELERRAALDTLVTQNVDGLHHLAGNSPDWIVEIHGNVREAKCLSCGWHGPMEETIDRVRAGEEDPACLRCGGMLKAATISFGENLVAADLPELALRNDATLVVLTAEETPYDPHAVAVVRDRLEAVLPAIVDEI